MKFLKITTMYPAYLSNVYSQNHKLEEKTYREQKDFFNNDGFFWEGYWGKEFSRLGYETEEVVWNCEFLQRTWAKEYLSKKQCRQVDLETIAIEQALKFKPDIVWLHHWDSEFLERIRDEVKSVKLILGWVGSHVPDISFFNNVDVMLSCAPESVDALSKRRPNVYHIDHWFVPDVLKKLKKGRDLYDVSFVGELLRGDGLHLEREKLMLGLSKNVNLQIFTSSYDVSYSGIFTKALMMTNYFLYKKLCSVGFSRKSLNNLPVLNSASKHASMPMWPINFKLKPCVKPGVFGLDMLQVFRDSKMTLNIHADSSTKYASNLRLFEATGVASCLITDWKENIGKLFDPDKEVITYKSFEECKERVKWFLDHPRERKAMASAAQKRTLKDHTIALRAIKIDKIIKSVMMM